MPYYNTQWHKITYINTKYLTKKEAFFQGFQALFLIFNCQTPERTVYMGLSPFHDGAEFLPVGNVFKFYIIKRRAGNNHAVELSLLYLVESCIKGFQVVGIGMLRRVACGLQKFHGYLKGGIGELAKKLCFRDDFGRHQVQDQHIQRPYILMNCAKIGHDKNIFFFQSLFGRKGILDFNRHDLFLHSV